jgi:hypothetical protein
MPFSILGIMRRNQNLTDATRVLFMVGVRYERLDTKAGMGGWCC